MSAFPTLVVSSPLSRVTFSFTGCSRPGKGRSAPCSPEVIVCLLCTMRSARHLSYHRSAAGEGCGPFCPPASGRCPPVACHPVLTSPFDVARPFFGPRGSQGTALLLRGLAQCGFCKSGHRHRRGTLWQRSRGHPHCQARLGLCSRASSPRSSGP